MHFAAYLLVTCHSHHLNESKAAAAKQLGLCLVQDVASGAFLSAAPAPIKPSTRYGYAANQPALMYTRNASLPSMSVLRHYAPQLSLPEALKSLPEGLKA